MDTFFEHFYGKSSGHQAPKRGCAPELFIVSTSGIETNDEVGFSNELGEVFDIEREVIATAFFTSFN
jgi:hypothetical protein